MSRKILYIDPLDCTGCRNCEIACSYAKEGLVNPQKSRIRVLRIGATYDGLIV
ncbi:MAG: 4Fe-4S binding protein, partial [Candidatus Hadarchaeum sp.]|uniref:4Fe-4S binding protein n=1 Tax=Candidatus Hadarchaeum sp. TaxID=2883567 RepID=UPI003D13FF64